MSEGKNEQNIAEVLVAGVPKSLAYHIGSTTPEASVGDIVSVEVGKRRATGWLINITDRSSIKLLSKSRAKTSEQLSLIAKETKNTAIDGIKPLLDNTPAFTPELLEMFQWISSYYGSKLSDVIDTALPKISRGRKVKRFYLGSAGAALLGELENGKSSKVTKKQLVLAQLAKLGNVGATSSDLKDLSSSVSTILSKLEKEGLVSTSEFYKKSTENSDSKKISDASKNPELNKHQRSAVEAIKGSIKNKLFEPFLLHGVTGSGKTEVYLSCIEEVLKNGGSALVIVPEISLTPQAVDRFRSRLEVKPALLHSQVGATERWQAWTALLEGRLKVAIGARSAIFAPMKNLSLIVVDEEHEQSYKQSDGVRYNGRDLAILRARLSSCPVVLGSATPSFESLLNAKKNIFKLLEMPERATPRPVPELEIVDLNKFRPKEMASESISPPLADALVQTIRSGEQAVILYNRRGFSSYLQCDSCGKVVTCPDCSISMTWHKRTMKLCCHFCDKKITAPELCSTCRDPDQVRIDQDDPDFETHGKLSHRGGGTEKVVDELLSLCPSARIVRMDRDTVGQKGSHRKIIEAMHSGEADILVGTQMIAKGHDLPGVTLVGIIDADIGLNLPDFRSSERAFQLITQAGGRAGRGENPGRVLVQTRQPNHPVIVATSSKRFSAFARYELDHRKVLDYPPHQRLLRFIVSSPDPSLARNASEHLTKTVKEIFSETTLDSDSKISHIVLGPAPAAYEKLRGRFRWHVLVKCSSASYVSALAAKINLYKKDLIGKSDLRIAVDVDPVEML